jgi:hypothetical protein
VPRAAQLIHSTSSAVSVKYRTSSSRPTSTGHDSSRRISAAEKNCVATPSHPESQDTDGHHHPQPITRPGTGFVSPQLRAENVAYCAKTTGAPLMPVPDQGHVQAQCFADATHPMISGRVLSASAFPCRHNRLPRGNEVACPGRVECV